jgi:hypothetical protein
MLSGLDDHLGHQLPTTFDHVGTSDPAWTERLWYTLHDIESGEIIFDCGLGQYPNKNVQDAFAGVTVGSTQYNVRMSRALRPNTGEAKVGPLSFHVIEGLKKHRLTLEKNESGMSFDIEWEAVFNPHEENHHFRRRAGRVAEDLSRYSQLGRARGVIELPGKTLHLDPKKWWGQRDHSWGIRAELLTDPSQPQKTFLPPLFYSWTTAQFPRYGIHWFFNERAPHNHIFITGEVVNPLGEQADKGLRVVGVDHHFEWAPHRTAQTLLRAELTLHLAKGEKREITLRALPARYFLRTGMYGGWRGWIHGDYKGPYYFEHDVWDLRDEAFLKAVGTFSDHLIECREGDEIGYGVMEYGVSRGYPKYGEVQHLPTF